MNTIETEIGTISLDCVQDPPDERDYLFSDDEHNALPIRLDHRNDVVRIMNQSPEAACVGHAVCAAAEFLFQRKCHLAYDFSQRFLYRKTRENDQWPGENYEGTSTRDGLKTWKKLGICEERYWPWIPYDVRFGSSHFQLVSHEDATFSEDAMTNALQFRISSYEKCLTTLDIKKALALHGVLVARSEIHTGWKIYGTDSIRWDESCQELGGHAYVIVGYDDERSSFVVLNSWGTKWGNQGFASLQYNDFWSNGGTAWVPILDE
ncbi:MAG: C1 family peptidase [Spirochaetales bacterium]|nr:C1 family peptidase [Spirochaetales bacterium]